MWRSGVQHAALKSHAINHCRFYKLRSLRRLQNRGRIRPIVLITRRLECMSRLHVLNRREEELFFLHHVRFEFSPQNAERLIDFGEFRMPLAMH
jgi:hypothetical protein